MPTKREFSDDELNREIAEVFPAGDRLRLVALDRTQCLAAAKTRSLQRELRIAQIRHPNDAARIREATQRVKMQQLFARQTISEIQRSEVPAPIKNPGTLILHGRVVDRARLGQKGLVVSAVGADGKASTISCTDGNGAFQLEIPERKDAPAAVTLLVSDAGQAILSRGTEVFPVAGNKVIYREIVLSGEPGKPVPTPPPPLPERVVVPEVVGLQQAEALRILRRSGLLARIEMKETIDEKIGLVLAQEPRPKASVEAGSSVQITVGVAGQDVPVPDVTGGTFAEAAGILKRAQLRVGAVDPPNPGNAGVVLAQMPEVGQQVERGSPVDLKVQPNVIEPPTALVPNVVGLTLDNTSSALERQKLKLGQTNTRPASEKQVGRVLSQKPPAESKVAPGSEVAIVVGVQQRVAVPSVVDSTLRAAQTTLKKADLAVGKVEPAGAPLVSRVVQQLPAAGEQVPPSTPVDLVTEEALPPVKVPKVVTQAKRKKKAVARGASKKTK